MQTTLQMIGVNNLKVYKNEKRNQTIPLGKYIYASYKIFYEYHDFSHTHHTHAQLPLYTCQRCVKALGLYKAEQQLTSSTMWMADHEC